MSKARKAAPGSLDIVSAMNHPGMFKPYFKGRSWNGWRMVLKGAFALPMTEAEREFFRTIAEREPPAHRVKELWIVAGRRAGKDSIASLIVAHAAALFADGDDRLRPGERALCMCLACDRDQSKIVLNYTRSYFSNIPPLKAMVTRETSTGFELNNSVDIAVATNSFRSVRGRPILCAVFDEVAFWRDDASASPDEETYNAVKPGMATMPDAMLIGISSPYRKAGLLYKKFHDHFGRDGDILVVRAASAALNPTLDQAIIDQALRADPAAARAEWLAEFRTDVAAFLDDALIDAAIDLDRPSELPPRVGTVYVAFVDAAGGVGADSYTLAIAHREGDLIVVDAIRGTSSKFNPAEITRQYAALAKGYGISTVVGDAYGSEWVAGAWREAGVAYVRSDQNKSAIYLEAMPLFARGVARLPDHACLLRELRLLERRTSRLGKDVVDHPRNAGDDYAAAVAGALMLAETAPRALWSRESYAGPAEIPRRAAIVFAVVAAGEREIGGCFFARSRDGNLFVIDVLAAAPAPQLFDSVIMRLVEFARATRASRGAYIFTSVALAAEFARRGQPVHAVDAIFAEGADALALGAAMHIANGRVRVAGDLLQKRDPLVAHGGVDDPLRLAALVGIAVALDEGRALGRAA